jgi:signal transduction histidine kinase
MPTIEGSGILLYQLFYNLVYNSLKFSRDEELPVITITSQLHNHNNIDTVTISIRDNGIGFDNKYKSKIFSAFTRLNSKDKYEGTGLGLALCQKVVERHGGDLTASGEENKGATFHILLPLKQTDKGLPNLLSRI